MNKTNSPSCSSIGQTFERKHVDLVVGATGPEPAEDAADARVFRYPTAHTQVVGLQLGVDGLIGNGRQFLHEGGLVGFFFKLEWSEYRETVETYS
jgi:hypothetical protein